MSSERSALVDGLCDAAGAEPGEFFAGADQLDLLRDDKGKLPKDALRQARKGPGRPAGSKNRRQKDIANWFIQKFGDPLHALGEIMTMPLDILYEQMVLAQGGEHPKKKLTGKDALQLKMAAMNDVVPYIHGKKPITIDRTGNPDAVIIIPGMNAPLGDTGVLSDAIEKLGLDSIGENAIITVDGREVTQEELLAIGQAEADDAA